MVESSITSPTEQPSTQPSFVEEMQRNYPEAYERFMDRIRRFVKIIDGHEKLRNKHGLAGYPKGTEPILPEDEAARNEVLQRIGDGFATFVLKTREGVIRQAELEPSDVRAGRIAAAMGGLNTMIGSNLHMNVKDAVERVSDMIMDSDKAGQQWIERLYYVPYNPEGIRTLAKLHPEDRAIEAVGLLLAARLQNNISASMDSLSRRDMPKFGITTVDGNPADVADTILRSAGAHPFSSPKSESRAA